VPMRGSGRNGSSRSSVSRSVNESEPANGNSAIASNSEEAKGKRLNPIKRKQMEDRVHEIEEDIARVEAAIAHCEAALLTFVSAEDTQQQNKELATRRSELASLMNEWEELSQTL
jgi:ATP-binding cassette, subfamily F, member 3